MAVVESFDAVGPEPAVLLHTEIRGDAVSARWERGRLTGDDELVRRVANLAAWRRLNLRELEPAQIINLAREACAAPIQTELVLPDVPVSDRAGDPTGPRSRPPRRT